MSAPGTKFVGKVGSPGLLRLGTRLRALLDGDLVYSFLRSPLAVIAGTLSALVIVMAILAPWLAPHDPWDPASIELMNAQMPPAWLEGGSVEFLLGTDYQGRDILSLIMYGTRVSLFVGFASVFLAMVLGMALGLVSGYVGGYIDSIIMRIADIQLTFPAILIALMIDGFSRAFIPRDLHNELAIYVVIMAIALSSWVQFARTARGSTMVEVQREYVQAARIIGVKPFKVVLKHIRPNIMSPMLVIATIQLAVAILTEATLSFLGVGVPPSHPSLGTLIRIGNEYLFSGLWWITIFPCVMLVVLVVSVNLLGDWLRDAFNPKLR